MLASPSSVAVTFCGEIMVSSPAEMAPCRVGVWVCECGCVSVGVCQYLSYLQEAGKERDTERACLGPLCRGLEAWAMTTQSIAHYYRSPQAPRRRPTRELRAPQRPRGQPASCRKKVHGARWT
jgi:hypothetical protein